MQESKQSSQALTDEDLDFVADCRAATLQRKTPYTSALLFILTAFLLIGLIWSYFAVLDEMTAAQGKVIPPSQVKVIQNLEGGILQEILVSEGQEVKKDQILIRIDDTRFAASYREQQLQYFNLLASVARLTAETEGKDHIDFPVELQSHPDLITRETNLFNTRKKALEDNLQVLTRSYELAKKELEMSIPLVEQGVMSKIELLRLQRQVNEMNGAIAEKLDKFKEEAHTELTKQKGEIASLAEALLSQQDRVKRTIVRSPVNGTVKTININTIGGVIQPGMDIMEIVPEEDYLIIEARVQPKDIAFIKIGQKAKVKFTAYDFSIYGGLEGTVTYISADTITDDTNKQNTYYEVLVKTDKNYLGTESNPLPIKVGMVTDVDILTGRKSVLDYLLKPLLKAKQKAFTER